MAEKKVTIRLPLTRTEKDDVWVGINGSSWMIKRGEEVEVPASVADALMNSERMLRESMAFEIKAAAPLADLEKE